MPTLKRRIIRVQRLAKRPCAECGDIWRAIEYEISSRGFEKKISTVCYVNGHSQDRSHSALAQQRNLWEANLGVL